MAIVVGGGFESHRLLVLLFFQHIWSGHGMHGACDDDRLPFQTVWFLTLLPIYSTIQNADKRKKPQSHISIHIVYIVTFHILQVYSVHIDDAQLHCQWSLLSAVLWPTFFLLIIHVSCWTACYILSRKKVMSFSAPEHTELNLAHPKK